MTAEDILNLLADDRFVSLTNGAGWTIRYVIRDVECFVHNDTLDKLLDRFQELLDTENA